MDRLEEDDFLVWVGEAFWGVDVRHERVEEGTNEKPCAEGAKRQRRATVDFIIVKRL